MEVAVGIIKNNDGKYLLVSTENKRFGEFSGAFYPPGGHIDKGENQEKALAREIFEELGIKIKPIRCIATTPGDIESQITHWWECEIIEGSPSICDKKEISDFGYFSFDEMKKIKIWPATLKFFEKY